MAETKLGQRDEVVFAESLAFGSSAESIATAGGTIPANCGEIVVVCPAGDNLHWLPNGTPTSTFGHKLIASRVVRLATHQQGSLFISDDASDVTCIIIYMRGAGRQDAAYSQPASL